MEKGKTRENPDEETAVKVLDNIYGLALKGVPKMSRSVKDLAEDYIKENESKRDAAKRYIKSWNEK